MLELTDFLIEKHVTLIYWDLNKSHQLILPFFQNETEVKVIKDIEELWEWNKAVTVKYLILGIKKKEKLEEIKNELRKVPIDQRRKLFIIYISPHLETLNRLQAFLYEANLVVNTKDLKDLDKIINKSRIYWEALYKPFNKALEQIEKD
ncbi:MAG: hypothetical protein ACK4FM_03335 [Caldimicrobium sp.]